MRHGLLDAASLQRLLCDALDHSDDIVLILEQTGDDAEQLVIASANDAFCRATGYDHAELSGPPLCSLIVPDNKSSHCAAIFDAARERRSLRSELQCVRKNGAAFWFGLHLMPARDTTPLAITSDTGVIQMTNPAARRIYWGTRRATWSVGRRPVRYARFACGGNRLAGAPDRLFVGNVPAPGRWHSDSCRDHLDHGATRRPATLPHCYLAESGRHGRGNGKGRRRDIDKLAELVNRLHAYQPRVLVRHVASWEDARPLARVGVDLISMVSDERDTNNVTD